MYNYYIKNEYQHLLFYEGYNSDYRIFPEMI